MMTEAGEQAAAAGSNPEEQAPELAVAARIRTIFSAAGTNAPMHADSCDTRSGKLQTAGKTGK